MTAPPFVPVRRRPRAACANFPSPGLVGDAAIGLALVPIVVGAGHLSGPATGF